MDKQVRQFLSALQAAGGMHKSRQHEAEALKGVIKAAQDAGYLTVKMADEVHQGVGGRGIVTRLAILELTPEWYEFNKPQQKIELMMAPMGFHSRPAEEEV